MSDTVRPKVIRLPEVAAITAIPERTLRWWRQQNKGEGPPLFKVGSHVVAYEHEVYGWLDEQRKKAG